MINKNIQIHKILWRGIAITIKFNPNWSTAYKNIQGFAMTHTAVSRDDGKRLPISNSGYVSRFMDERDFENYDNIVAYIIAWLDHEAQSKSWKIYLADQQQLKLF